MVFADSAVVGAGGFFVAALNLSIQPSVVIRSLIVTKLEAVVIEFLENRR